MAYVLGGLALAAFFLLVPIFTLARIALAVVGTLTVSICQGHRPARIGSAARRLFPDFRTRNRALLWLNVLSLGVYAVVAPLTYVFTSSTTFPDAHIVAHTTVRSGPAGPTVVTVDYHDGDSYGDARSYSVDVTIPVPAAATPACAAARDSALSKVLALQSTRFASHVWLSSAWNAPLWKRPAEGEFTGDVSFELDYSATDDFTAADYRALHLRADFNETTHNDDVEIAGFLAGVCT